MTTVRAECGDASSAWQRDTVQIPPTAQLMYLTRQLLQLLRAMSPFEEASTKITTLRNIVITWIVSTGLATLLSYTVSGGVILSN